MDFLSQFLAEYRTHLGEADNAGQQLNACERFLDFIASQLAADPIVSFNVSAGALTRRSGGQLKLPRQASAGFQQQPPAYMLGPVGNYGPSVQAPFAVGFKPGGNQ